MAYVGLSADCALYWPRQKLFFKPNDQRDIYKRVTVTNLVTNKHRHAIPNSIKKYTNRLDWLFYHKLIQFYPRSHLNICLFLFTCLFIYLFTRLFIYLLHTCLLIYLFTYLHIYLYIYLFISY